MRAFVPPGLPPTPPIDILSLLPHLSAAERALGRLDGITVLLPRQELFLYMYVRKEAVLSSCGCRSESVVFCRRWERWHKFCRAVCQRPASKTRSSYGRAWSPMSRPSAALLGGGRRPAFTWGTMYDPRSTPGAAADPPTFIGKKLRIHTGANRRGLIFIGSRSQGPTALVADSVPVLQQAVSRA